MSQAPPPRTTPAIRTKRRSPDDLGDMLLAEFASLTLPVKEIFERHNIGRPYLLENYKTVLKELEAAGKVKCTPPAASRPKRHGEPTMADTVRVVFQRRQ